jgi:hypothetical protein
MNKCIASDSVSEGELVLALMLLDSIKENFQNQVPNMIAKYGEIAKSPRFPVRHRLYAVYLISIFKSLNTIVELGLLSSVPEDMTVVADSLETFLENMADSNIQSYVYSLFQKVITTVGNKHPLFKNLVSLAEKVYKKNDE